MTAEIIDGRKIAEELRKQVWEEVARLYSEGGDIPGLGVVLVGEDPASAIYVAAKEKAAKESGIRTASYHLPGDSNEVEVVHLVEELNRSLEFHGLLVQLPLPPQIDAMKVIGAIDPLKDVDGLHPTNMGLLLMGEPRFVPCTPAGIQHMLLAAGHPPDGKHMVIVGRSSIVGRPLAALMLQKKPGANATVTICHTGTGDLAALTRQADILVAAVDTLQALKGEMVKEGAVVVDVGIHRVEDPTRKRGYRLVGDVDFDSVKEKAKAISPVPGGVGPMTVAMLLVNTLKAAGVVRPDWADASR